MVEVWSVIVLFTQTVATTVCCEKMKQFQYMVSLKHEVPKHTVNTGHENPTHVRESVNETGR
jgi:hypothetical protein